MAVRDKASDQIKIEVDRAMSKIMREIEWTMFYGDRPEVSLRKFLRKLGMKARFY